MHNGKGLVSVFQEFSISIGSASFLVGGGAGRWVIALWFRTFFPLNCSNFGLGRCVGPWGCRGVGFGWVWGVFLGRWLTGCLGLAGSGFGVGWGTAVGG